MKKLWHKKDTISNPLLESFTVGRDHLFDTQLVEYDCIGSIAHAAMLKKIGILNNLEFKALKNELVKIIQLSQQKSFHVLPEHEDSHTAIELFLTKQVGPLGEKIHTARSRNDQAALMLRLYMRDLIIEVADKTLDLCQALSARAKKYEYVPIPGRTHFQQAMPSSVGLWASSYTESLLDTVQMLGDTYKLINQCPLGAAAGYGVSLDIDREYVARLLHFDKVQHNVVYAISSRGKFESIVLHALAQIMVDLSRLAHDIIIFSTSEFGYFSLAKSTCTGSSIMPQKNNPDVLELIRAKGVAVEAHLLQVLGIVRMLPSGYHRDMQETKGPLLESASIVQQSLDATITVLNSICVDETRCIQALRDDIFATDYALTLAKEGMPFRKAYRWVAHNLNNKTLKQDPVENIKKKTHSGATGNLKIDEYELTIQKLRANFKALHKNKELILEQLANV